MSPNIQRAFTARYPLIVLVLAPLIALAALVIGSAAAEIALDHLVLGRGPDGMPALENLPLIQFGITAWNQALMYVAPPAAIVLICALANKHGVAQSWKAAGGGLIVLAGSLYHVQTVWTGVKGTSQLYMGLESHWLAIVVRLALNGAVLFLALGPIQRRRAPG